MKTGMITGESNSDYHGNICVSTSTIKDFIKSKYLYYRKYIAKDVERKETDAMRFGSSFHELVLEPDVFWENHALLPDDCNLRTKSGREAKAELEESGKTILTKSELDAMKRLSNSVYANKSAALLLTNGEAEEKSVAKEGELIQISSNDTPNAYVFDRAA